MHMDMLSIFETQKKQILDDLFYGIVRSSVFTTVFYLPKLNNSNSLFQQIVPYLN